MDSYIITISDSNRRTTANQIITFSTSFGELLEAVTVLTAVRERWRK